MNSAENGKEVAGIDLVESLAGKVAPRKKPPGAASSREEPDGEKRMACAIRTVRERPSVDTADGNAAGLSINAGENRNGQALNPEAVKESDRGDQGLNPAAGEAGSNNAKTAAKTKTKANEGCAERDKKKSKDRTVAPTENGGAEDIPAGQQNPAGKQDSIKQNSTGKRHAAKTRDSTEEQGPAVKQNAPGKQDSSATVQADPGKQNPVAAQVAPGKQDGSATVQADPGKQNPVAAQVAPGKQDGSATVQADPGKQNPATMQVAPGKQDPAEKRKNIGTLEEFGREIFPFLELKPFHRAYYRVLEAFARGRIRRLMISMPPQHGKSLGATTLLPAYLLGLNPDLRVAIASYSASLASKFNRRVQRILESKEYRELFPDTTIKHGARPPEYIRTADEVEIIGREGSLLSVGREGSLTGNRVDCFILDDLYKDALEANSPLVRENCREWYTSVVKTRMHNDSSELLVFTRWHEEDLIGDLQRAERVVGLREWEQIDDVPADVWVALNFEAVKESEATEVDPRMTGEALWPERQSVALLEAKRRLDPVRFETMYQGHPSSAEGLLYGSRFQVYERLPEVVHHVGNYTDTADTGDDYLCSLCYVAGADGTIYITDAVYTREAMEVTELSVSEMFRRNETRRADIESNNGGRGFARAVQRLAPGTAVNWFHQSGNKEARILSHSATVLHRLRWPADWAQRWPELHSHLATYRRKFSANRWHDAADVVTGIVERECSASGKKGGRVRFI